MDTAKDHRVIMGVYGYSQLSYSEYVRALLGPNKVTPWIKPRALIQPVWVCLDTAKELTNFQIDTGMFSTTKEVIKDKLTKEIIQNKFLAP